MAKRDDARDELELLEAVIEHQGDAWNAFFERYQRLIIACVRKALNRCSVAPSPEELEDHLNSVCLELVKNDYKKLRAYDPNRGYKVSSWIGLIATNAVYDALRRRGPPLASLDDTDNSWQERPDPGPSPADIAEHVEKRKLLFEAVQFLSPGERTFVHHYYQEGLEPQEIADLLGVSVNTIYSRKNKVRANLQRIVDRLMSERGPV